jgi:chemotaxis protein methyltransferase CheR
LFEPRPPLSPVEFRLIADLFRERAGLQFDEASTLAFERRLGERVIDLGLTSFHDYYRYLRFAAGGEDELATALGLITTAETYFFRQDYQLRSFQNDCLPLLARRNAGTKRLSVWSAGCSTGEGVYTLAILIQQSALFEGWAIRVIGSDLSGERVARARRGVYRESSFRTTSPEMRARYFEPEGDLFRVRDAVKTICQFGQLNLASDSAFITVGRVDVVFCRNVLIYFSESAKAKVIQQLYDRLVPGGYLFLGHSESLLNVTTAFELAHLTEDLAYRKPDAASFLEGPR